MSLTSSSVPRARSTVDPIDANLLPYACHPRAELHEKSHAWLEAVLSGPDFVRFAWLMLWAFLRIATNPRVFDRPLSTSEAEAAISSWFAQPTAGILGFRRLSVGCDGGVRSLLPQAVGAGEPGFLHQLQVVGQPANAIEEQIVVEKKRARF
jgi:hypothetical protein